MKISELLGRVGEELGEADLSDFIAQYNLSLRRVWGSHAWKQGQTSEDFIPRVGVSDGTVSTGSALVTSPSG